MYRLDAQGAMPRSTQGFELLEAQANGGGRFARIEVGPGDRRPLYSRPFNPETDSPLDIDPFDHYGIAFGEPYVSVQRLRKHLQVGVFSLAMSEKDLGHIDHTKRDAQEAILSSVQEALPRFRDEASMQRVESLEDVFKAGQPKDLKIVVGDFANVKAGVTRRMYDATPTILLKVNHQLEREVPADMGSVNLDGKQVVNTDDPEELTRYNNKLDMEHQMTLARLRRLGFVTASTVIDPSSGYEHGGVVGLSVEELDETLAEALHTVSRARR